MANDSDVSNLRWGRLCPVPGPSNASTFPRHARCDAYLALGLLAACTSRPISIPGAGSDAVGSPSDGPAVSPLARDTAGTAADASPRSRGDAPTTNATGDLPLGWKSSAPIGAPGWRNTPTPLCDVQQGWAGTSGVWADSRGVFVLDENYCYYDEILAGCPNDGQDYASTILVFNDGSGWRKLFEDTSVSSSTKLTGIPNGPIVLAGNDCALSQLDPDTGTETCWFGEDWWYGQSVFVVNQAVAYASDTQNFFEFRVGAWTQEVSRSPDTLHVLWGSEDVAYLAGDYQLYIWARANPSALVPLPNAPAASFAAAWGFADNDVWFGNSFGQLIHYDGTSFTIVQASLPERQGILGLWGQDGLLYFNTATEFGRVVDGNPETLLTVPGSPSPPAYGGAQIQGMWGISPTDVFLALMAGSDDNATPCRHNSMFWFDGQTFHQF